MNLSLGKITAHLGQPEEDRLESLVEIINRNINPPTVLQKDDVYIRSMYIVSEEINSYGGRFQVDELYRIEKLIIDSPVMVGHRKDKLPVGRNFHAEVLEKDNQLWVKCYFYWLKNADGAEDLKENLDGGIYKECSIGFTFLFPECSICGKDIRTCRHEPLAEYSKGGTKFSCFFYYRQIDKVLETSLVYRGAVPGTSISKELFESSKFISQEKRVPRQLSDISELPSDSHYIMTPRYDSLDVIVNANKNGFELFDFSGNLLDSKCLQSLFYEGTLNLKNHFGILIGYQGKERCRLSELQKYITGKSSAVRRVELHLFPTEDLVRQKEFLKNSKNIKQLRFKSVSKDEIDSFMEKIMTKDGVRLWSIADHPLYDAGYYYEVTNHNIKEEPCYRLSMDENNIVCFHIQSDNLNKIFMIESFNHKQFVKGCRFAAQQIPNNNSISKNRILSQGLLLSATQKSDSIFITLKESPLKRIIVQSIRVNGKDKQILYMKS